MSTALIYLNPGLPVRIEKAHRLVYLPDGSQHVLDVHDRPLFSAPPKTGVCIVMEYSTNEDATDAQVAMFARKEHAEKVEQARREELAADQTQQFPQVHQNDSPPHAPTPKPDMVNVNTSTGRVTPLQQRPPVVYPPVAQFTRTPQMQPGDVKVHQAADIPSDVTGETVMPDFSTAPQGATQGEPSPVTNSEATHSIPERADEAS